MKTLLIALSFFISLGIHPFGTNVFSQNITNTLGTNGSFKIKDSSNNYLTLSQATGHVNILKSLRLENTTSSSQGILFKGTDRFLHNFGYDNTFLGIYSGNFTMTGYSNTAVGTWTFFNTTGKDNTAIGSYSLYSNTTGSNNTAVGWGSVGSNTIGNNNTALGDSSLNNNTSGSDNTAVGLSSLGSNFDGARNTALGVQSLKENTSGDSNIAVGYQSMYSNTTGFNNTTLGNGSLRSNTTGYFNTAVGLASLVANSTGNYNTGLGSRSLLSSIGEFNTSLGYSSASTTTTGNNVTCIGYNADASSGTVSNQITLGNNQISSLRCNVQTITSLSDGRDKKNIKDLSLGLDFLMKVKPRLFQWDKREWYDNNNSDGSKMQEAPTAGFIAQELDEVQTTENAEWLDLVLKDNPEKFEATYGNLLPVMVKAIQELKSENEELKKEVESLKSISEKFVKLEQLVNELTSINHTTLCKKTEIKTISNK